MDRKLKPKWPLERLKSMYFGAHCWKCKKTELPSEEYGKICENKIQKIIDNIELKEMRFKEFSEIIKASKFCNFEKRNFDCSCRICKKFGIEFKL